MKKTLLLFLLAALCVSFVSCNDSEAPETTDGTTEPAQTTIQYGPSNDGPDHRTDVSFGTDQKTLTPVSDEKPKVETLTFDGYTAVTSDEVWQVNSGLDYSQYDYMGSGEELVKQMNEDDAYSKYKKVYYKVSTNTITVDPAHVSGLACVGAKRLVVKDEKTVYIFVQQITPRIMPKFSSVTGEAGAYLIAEFNCNMTAICQVGIAKTKTDVEGAVFHKNIVPIGKDGVYTAAGKMSIPYVDPGDYYINFSCGGKILASIPITITEGHDPRNDTYHLQYAGDWDKITAKGYQESLTDLFYNSYPKLYARWGTGSEPKTVTFIADSTYDGVAYSLGRTVVVSTAFANANPKPSDIGFFSHEITHQVQQYWFDSSWWTENMANFGGFRYYHWSNANAIQLYQDANQNDLYDWNWQPYGDGSKWFLTYLDAHWPTSKNADGSLKLGLIDTINKEIKNGRLTGKNDDPKDKTNEFNTIVKEITGFDCMEDIRQKYAAEFKSKEWDFKGFGNFTDNFLTENLPQVENPVYPMITDKVPGDKTAKALDSVVTEGNNLCKDATIYKSSGQTKDAESAEKLIDGDPATKWCSTPTSSSDKSYGGLDGTQHWVVIDLGSKKTFNTYTLLNTKTKETFNNMTEWELLISDDAQNWTSVDYQPKLDADSASFNIGTQSARYLLLKVYNADNGASGTVRLYEFELYNQ